MADSIIRNEYGEVVYMGQPLASVSAAAPGLLESAETAQQVANNFVRENLPQLNLGDVRLDSDLAARGLEADQTTPVVTFIEEKDIAGAKVVVYKQKAVGIDVFEARLGVQIDGRTMNVASLQSSAHGQIGIENPEAKGPADGRPVSAARISDLLGFELPRLADGTSPRQVVYRYELEAREEPVEHENLGCLTPGGVDVPRLPPLTLRTLARGKHYICDEILFSASRNRDEEPVNWRMLVEPVSGDVLYLRALVGCATGLVFARDPQTLGGDTATGASSNAVLNAFRSSHTLAGLIAGTPQALAGEFVALAETSAPVIAAPIVPGPASAFNYDVRTDEFSAVNAYYHCDRLFRTMQDFGFDVPSYFDGTSFPVPVDHRALGNAVNAQAPGTPAGTGLMELRFALLQAGEPVGIATSNRVVWHEFGHGLLWDHVGSANFGFAHSAGDALAAILNDPGTLEADRFDTFPWIQQATDLGRRHDREVSAGWAWFGPQYNTQYRGEQILATTMFRFYRAIGGDAEYAGGLPTQLRASEASAYLIFKAIGLLTSTTTFPEVFVQALQTADLTTPSFKGVPGGGLHKVLRWAFEKQGLFQPGAAPGQGNAVSSEGLPPDVDVYIDDGRNGEYQYQANHWSCHDMWVRRSADGGTAHQEPAVGQPNFLYVRVKNRGTQTAADVHVDAYHCLPGTGLAFPDDWAPMSTPSLPAPGPIPPGGDVVVGPFTFTPTEVRHECLLAIASAAGDPGNDTIITGTMPEHRLVPFDNNIGQRNVHPVLPTLKDILRRFRKHVLWIGNPFREAKMVEIKLELPVFMGERGWKFQVHSEGGARFELGARERRKIELGIEPGEELTPELVREAIAAGAGEIKLTTSLDGELSGGMSYPLSFEADEDEQPEPRVEEPARPLVIERPTISQLVAILQGRDLRRVTIEFEEDGVG